jgi:hypothetical protein
MDGRGPELMPILPAPFHSDGEFDHEGLAAAGGLPLSGRTS